MTLQLLWGKVNDNPGHEEHNAISSSNKSWNSITLSRYAVIPAPVTLKRFKVKLDAAPNGATKSRTFTIRKDSGSGFSDTSLTVTLTDSETEKTVVADVSFSKGDKIVLYHTEANSPDACSLVKWITELDTDNDDEFIVLANVGNAPSTSVVEYILPAQNEFIFWTSTEADAFVIAPIPGTIKNLVVDTDGNSPGSGSYEISLALNGTILNGGSDPVVDITDGNGGEDTTNTIDVAALDTISIASTPASTPDVISTWMISFVFVPDDPGKFPVFGRSVDDFSSNSSTEGIGPHAVGGDTFTTVDDTASIPMMGDYTLEAIACRKESAVGSGNDYRCHLQVDEGSGYIEKTGMQVTITNSSTNNAEIATTTAYEISDGYDFLFAEDPTSGPVRSESIYSFAFKKVSTVNLKRVSIPSII